MNENSTNPPGKGIARRRLLRGTFAAPAVLTMYSGGALAATSVTCVAKAQASPQTGGVVTGTPTDTFMRVQLHQTGSGSGIEFWLAGSSITTWTGASSIVMSGKFTLFMVGTNLLTTGPGGVNVDKPDATPSNPAKWVALRFDGVGTLVGVGATGGGSAITGSCWTSIY